MQTTELAQEVELRRLRFFIGRLDYLRSHMSASDQAILDALRYGTTLLRPEVAASPHDLGALPAAR